MKRLEFLIRDIRNMSNIGGGSYSDELLAMYFNEAQSEIRNVIFLANNEANILKSRYYFDTINGQSEYDLPDRVYAINSILTVRAGNVYTGRYSPLKYTSYKESGNGEGYSLFNNKLILYSSASYGNIEIVYNSQLPKLAIRSGKISSINANDVYLIDNQDTDIISKTDFLTFVDINGNIKKSDVRILNQSGSYITLDDVTGVSIGDYACIGSYSTTNSPLPIECEDFLRKCVERRIANGDSSSIDSSSTGFLTETEKNEISDIFSQSLDDVIYPILSPDSPWL